MEYLAYGLIAFIVIVAIGAVAWSKLKSHISTTTLAAVEAKASSLVTTAKQDVQVGIDDLRTMASKASPAAAAALAAPTTTDVNTAATQANTMALAANTVATAAAVPTGTAAGADHVAVLGAATTMLQTALAAVATPATPVAGSLDALVTAGGVMSQDAPSTLSPMMAAMLGATVASNKVLSDRYTNYVANPGVVPDVFAKQSDMDMWCTAGGVHADAHFANIADAPKTATGMIKAGSYSLQGAEGIQQGDIHCMLCDATTGAILAVAISQDGFVLDKDTLCTLTASLVIGSAAVQARVVRDAGLIASGQAPQGVAGGTVNLYRR